MFGNIPDESDRLKREICLLKSLRMLVGILFGPTDLRLFREEMMLETSLQSVGETKNESLFICGRKSKNCFFGYLIEDFVRYLISSAIVEKYLLKALAIVIGSLKVALLSMMELRMLGLDFSMK